MHAEVSCLLIAVGYVGVLYAGAACAGAVAFHALTTARSAGSDYRLSRDDPAVIRRRCVLVALVRTLLSFERSRSAAHPARSRRSALWLGCPCGTPFPRTPLAAWRRG
jgi:hypothetical protein